MTTSRRLSFVVGTTLAASLISGSGCSKTIVNTGPAQPAVAEPEPIVPVEDEPAQPDVAPEDPPSDTGAADDQPAPDEVHVNTRPGV